MDTTLTAGWVRGQWAGAAFTDRACEQYRGYSAQQPSKDNSVGEMDQLTA